MPPKLNIGLQLTALSNDVTKYPTNRVPQLDVPIIKRIPEDLQKEITKESPEDCLPLPIKPEKTLFNIWEETRTQTEIKWNKPENSDCFTSVFYEIQIRVGDNDWLDLAENRHSYYRVYYAEGVTIFGKTKIKQETITHLVQLRIRPVGVITRNNKEVKMHGHWCENILFSIEAKNPVNHIQNTELGIH
ncbi:uncharacterized protein LOC129927197 [Biomphalaria glabrata]|uniref:Uncharacterized protein LOC129927197 n=1 Tax=Biomphalaria glabrata TaxID=6526 RepID=A0A9W3ATH1_BIOGL|nr:uncharacterized protein LOC129927197 [Biomphalaria glabrata]XP_055890597.1 uncharacterized protein LOC129927197 [Biomphalaria glabrata]